MKKIIPFLVVLAVFTAGCFYAYNYFYGGTSYYTQITTNGEKTTEKATDGRQYTVYIYENQSAYNEQGEKTTVTLHESREKPLRLKAYLKLIVNPRKGVLRWEEVTKNELPEKVQNKLD
ncbi:YxeA family protein [Enterococcus massiliensis]|uniref:YxeA family protein n=1 Tax=Enterococcus massiliensis TaxID=1640685 RepID=UPI00065E50F2|nr:YxeA family protein [Enterococcus massiliensis]